MKKLFSRLLVPMILLAMLGTFFTVYAMNTTLSDKCPGCESVADVDQNGVVDADDALLVLYYGYFPDRYTLPGCPNHGTGQTPSVPPSTTTRPPTTTTRPPTTTTTTTATHPTTTSSMPSPGSGSNENISIPLIPLN